MSLARVYEPAKRCTDGPTPGAKALMAYFLGQFGSQGGKNLGIYNCRSVRGGTTTSLHGEGRACDLGINPHAAPYGTLLAEQLRLQSAELGVQCLIWNGRIWSGAYPDAGWRVYTGTNAHVDHIHLELTRAAATSLTVQKIQSVLQPAVALRAAAPVEDEMTPAQLDLLRRDLGFARDQIMTALGVPDPVNAPNALTPDELAAIAVARRVDVGFARDQILAKLAEPVPAPQPPTDSGQLAAIIRTLEDLGRRVAALEGKPTS
jgi:hypothetical protein